MPRIPILLIALFFFAGGVAHFLLPDFFIRIMPAYLSHHKELVIISGLFEIAGALGLLLPKTRLWAAYGLIALIIAVYPANINMALHPEKFPEVSVLLLYARLPLQFILVWFVWWSVTAERQQKSHTT